MLLAIATAVAQEAPLPQEDAPPLPVVEEKGAVGLGVTVGGGALPAANVVVYATEWLALDAGVGLRWGLGADLVPAIMLLGGAAFDGGGARYHHGAFLRLGATVPIDYTEAFVAGGYSARMFTRTGRHMFTIDGGPGWFFVRDVPMSVHEQPRFLLYARFGWSIFLG